MKREGLLRPVWVVERVRDGAYEHRVRCDRWWSPSQRRDTRLVALVLETMRHPAVREALEDSGNRAQRRKSGVTPAKLDRKPARGKR